METLVRATRPLVTALLLCGCASEQPLRKPPPSPAELSSGAPAPRKTDSASAQGQLACPSQRSATRVSTQDVAGGAAFVFTTSDDVRSLRERVAQLSVPVAVLRVPRRLDNIPSGVRLVFESEAPGDVNAVRRSIAEHARHLAQTCDLVFVEQTHADAQAAEPASAPSTDKARAKPRQQDTVKPASAVSKPDKRPTDAPKAKAKPKPKPKPKEDDKQKQADKPREGDQPQKPAKPPAPPLPRLPGVPPEPLPRFTTITQHAACGGGLMGDTAR